MNLDRYEKIDGREALKRLADGEIIYDSYGTRYEVVHRPVFDEVGLYYTSKDGGNGKSRIEVSVVLSNKWYIPKPFDVRQAMIERPNEWVGAFEDRKGEWHKVGFDTESFMAIETSYDSTVKCEFYAYNVRQATEKEMYACIPIEDVPEEATR